MTGRTPTEAAKLAYLVVILGLMLLMLFLVIEAAGLV
jgi:hypothetical protein